MPGIRRRILERRVTDARVEYPTTRQFAVTPIPGRQDRTAVDTAAHDDTWPLAIQIGHASQKAIATVPIVVVAAIAADATPAVDRIATSGCSPPFSTPRRVRPSKIVKYSGPSRIRPCRRLPSSLMRQSFVLVSDHRSLAVRRSIGRLAGDFGPAVAIQVVHHELRVVLAVADVDPQIDAPACACHPACRRPGWEFP